MISNLLLLGAPIENLVNSSNIAGMELERQIGD